MVNVRLDSTGRKYNFSLVLETSSQARGRCTCTYATVLLADHLCKLWKSMERNYKIIAVDFASQFCINCGNSANTHPIFTMDTQLVGISI